jgi:microcystin-dependent protein
MSTPFLGEVKMVSFNFPPKGWALCNGQLLPINQNQALFSILGTTYGGNGVQTFALPNLQGRVPLHMGAGFVLGQSGGEANHTLLVTEIPSHTHIPNANDSVSDQVSPSGVIWGGGQAAYSAGPFDTPMLAAAVPNAGGGQPHPNESPYLVITFVIALAGIFPSRN